MLDRTPQSLRPHLSADDLTGYANGTLASSYMLALAEHVAGCQACSEKLEAVYPLEQESRSIMRNIFEAPTNIWEHPDDEILSAYLADCIDPLEKELIEEHLGECSQCMTDVEQVRALLAEDDASPAVTASSHETPAPTHLPSHTSFSRVRQWLWTAGFALAVGLAMFFVLHNNHRLFGQPEKYAALERMLQERRTVLERRELLVKEQQAALALGQQQVAGERQRLDRDRKDLARKLAELNKPAPLHNTPLIPDARKLAYVAPLGGGITLTSPAGDEGDDPLPFALRYPLPGETVRPDAVVFRWETVRWKSEQGTIELARSYRVELTGPGGVVKESLLLKQPLWQPKPTDHILPGKLYSWKVFAYRDIQGAEQIAQSPQAPMTVTFRTASLGADQLQSGRDSTLRLGISLAQAGLLDDARQVIGYHIIASPDDRSAHEWLLRIDGLQARWRRSTLSQLSKFPRSQGAIEMRTELADGVLK